MNLQYKETGRVRAVRGCIAVIEGLERCIYGQLVKFGYETTGMIIGFNQEVVQALVIKEKKMISPGDLVTATLEPFNTPVGKNFIGRVVNVMAEPCDGEGPIEADDHYPIFRECATVLDREPVNEPLETGVKLLDALIPIGKGQRELVLGDKMTGKTTICTDTILNQKGKGVVCIYCSIGKSRAQMIKLVNLFKEHGAFEYSMIVSASAAVPPGQMYLAPYVASSLGDYFMYKGGDVLVVFDDFTKHAWAYRQISLLLGRAPGRGAYPGDIFYLHSRMIERAGRLNKKLGGGSMTFLPIIETLENDLTAYIPTNLVSMTDGQIFVSSVLFNEGFKPAVNIGLSVSRVGGKAQWPIVRKLAGAVRLDYIQYNELVRITRLQASVSKEVKRRLKRGEILISFITQYRDSPVSLPEQVFLFYAYRNDICIDLSNADLDKFKAEVSGHVQENNPELIKKIMEGKKLTAEIEEGLRTTLSRYVEGFTSYQEARQKEREAEERKRLKEEAKAKGEEVEEEEEEAAVK